MTATEPQAFAGASKTGVEMNGLEFADFQQGNP
jgi:hypothetical protein